MFRQELSSRSQWGGFLKDDKLALVQTPHHFFSPDPFERNLANFRDVPSEGNLFYGLVQDGNDMWDATFFCGSCAVLRRSALEEIGGVAVETVTEDAHTFLKLHRLGYRSAYLRQPVSAGLATESLSAHVGQRIRWARGGWLRFSGWITTNGERVEVAAKALLPQCNAAFFIRNSTNNLPCCAASIFGISVPHYLCPSSSHCIVRFPSYGTCESN